MKSLIFLSVLLSCNFVLADGRVAESRSTTFVERPEETSIVEGILQFHSVAGKNSPLIGAALGTKTGDNWLLGGRALMPMSYSDEINVYSMQVYSRFFVLQRRTQIYLEANLAQNIFSKRNDDTFFIAYGFGIGIFHKVSDEVSIGGMAGFDFSDANITETGIVTGTGSNIYPRIALATGFHF